MSRASARPFHALGKTVHLAPPYYRNMTPERFLINFFKRYFSQKKFPFIARSDSSLTSLHRILLLNFFRSFVHLFGHYH